MKKINLFLWGIVSTCITFFYRTEIYASDYSYRIATTFIVSTCAGLDTDIDNVETTLQNNIRSDSLCHAGAIFIGCSTLVGNETIVYLLSEYGIDALAKYCLRDNYGGTCRGKDICPDPGEWQAPTEDTFIYLDTEITVCSARYLVAQENGDFTIARVPDDAPKDEKYRKQIIKLYQPRDRSAFGNVNSLSNTCAINAGTGFEDDTGKGVYADKCWYTE